MPTYTEATEQLYGMLPAHYRRADADQPGALDQPFKRYLSTVGDQLQGLVDLIGRLGHVGDDGRPASDLADPDRADARWLPWLAQFPGVRLDQLLTTAERRTAIRTRKFDSGSLRSVKRILDVYVAEGGSYTITKHYGDDPWVVRIEVSGVASLSYDALAAANPTYAAVAATYETYDDFPSALAELARNLAAVKPAGVAFDVVAT